MATPVQPRPLQRDPGAAGVTAAHGPGCAQDHRPPRRLRAAAQRHRQPRRGHSGRGGRGRQRGEDHPVHHPHHRGGDRGRRAGQRPQLRVGRQCRRHPRSEPAVRLLRRRRPGHGLSGHGRVRRAGQRQRQPLRRPAHRLRRLHQHQPERAQHDLRRHLHRRRTRGCGRGGQVADSAGGSVTKVRQTGAAGHLQRRVSPPPAGSRSSSSPNAVSFSAGARDWC